MFDGDYSDPMTLFRLPRDMPFAIWLPATNLPEEIVQEICGLENR
jgi:hypothetical protein